MANKWKPLHHKQLLKVQALNDTMVDLVLINGWRRNELRQAIVNYQYGDDSVWFIPKKHKELEEFLLTDKEITLLLALQKDTHIKDISKSAGNKAINRHFKTISDKLGYLIVPHMIRATNATEMAQMGIPESIIQATMNHKNRKTTQGYIQPGQNEVLLAKKTQAEIITLDGKTMHEWRELVVQKNKQIARLEYKVDKLEAKYGNKAR